MAAKYWNPCKVLGIGPITDSFTCVGKTKKGQRCASGISKANRDEASCRIKDMSLLDIGCDDFGDLLAKLADATLCQSFHAEKKRYDQHKETVKEWLDLVERGAREACRDGDTVMGEPGDDKDLMRRFIYEFEERFKRS